MRCDFFDRPESRHGFDPNGSARCWRVDVPAEVYEGLTVGSVERLQAILTWAWSWQSAFAGRPIPRGSSRSGCFEVQTDEGIYTEATRRRFSFTKAGRSRVEWVAWE